MNSNGVPDDNDYGNWIKLNYDLSTNLIHYWSPDCGKLYNGWLGYDNEGGNMDMVLVFQGINLQKL